MEDFQDFKKNIMSIENSIEKNKKLIERYEFLRILPLWVTDEKKEEYIINDEDYEATFLDCLPEGWYKAFALDMCEELREALIANDCYDNYRLFQVKEKYGGLRWYDGGGCRATDDIVRKYEQVSEQVCVECGNPATKMSKGWILFYCDDCAKKYPYDFVSIEDEECPF